MDYNDAPGSPPLPAPDSEVADRLPKGDLPDEDMDFLDLNPDLTSRTDATFAPVLQDGHPGGFFVEEITAEELEAEEAATAQTPTTYDKREDFEPTIAPSPAAATQGQALWTHHRRLSNAQQSKFINYLDDQLLHIKRRFVQSHGLSDTTGYSTLLELLRDLKQLLDFIWLSVEPKNAPILTPEAYKQLAPPLFGQVDYLITMAGDMLEYTSRLDIKDLETATTLLKLLDSLDSKFARLIDGTIPGGKPMSKTEAVRLTAIAERTRISIPELFDKQGIEGFHYELSKIYERVLDRTT